MENILEIKNLKKYYGNIRGVEDVSLTLKKGDIYGFIGPNGAGKSTTIRTIMGLINKDKGTIKFNNKEFDGSDIEVKEKIGYLPSEIHLYEDMKVKDIFDYHASFYKKDTSKRRRELVKLLKIDQNKKIEDLSLGNLKKVGIVLSLMHEPELLILDEATSGLDPMMQHIFHNILLDEKKKGTTILYSSHILSEISNLCDRIGFIKEGKIIKDDTIENVLKDNYTYLIIESLDSDKIIKDLKLKVISNDNNKIKLLNNLDTNTLISKLSKYNINNLLIETISLEDLFENYYK